ncbi:MAG: L-histidine N(alpha)-methyltransferase [Alphaproteobacteria bacterium]
MTVLLGNLAVAGEREDFAHALAAGLSRSPKRIPCKFFYDAAGSELFERICALPEYYPTRTECALLQDRAVEIADLIGPDVELIEFGAGSLTKVKILLDALHRVRAYVPIDISGEYLAAVAAQLAAQYPKLEIRPVEADFTRPLDLEQLQPRSKRRIGFFPGSTIGNFAPDEAGRFLENAARLLSGGGLLVGVDLVKDPAVLHAAYNDSAGITAAFNKNLLARANRELEADFDLDKFAHYASYNAYARRIEMYLVSLERQTVSVAGNEVVFAEGEAVHTEDSHKYTVDGFCSLAAWAGFKPRAVWCDPDRKFSVHWLETR